MDKLEQAMAACLAAEESEPTLVRMAEEIEASEAEVKRLTDQIEALTRCRATALEMLATRRARMMAKIGGGQC